MQENSKEFVMYESFDELPDELKEKFKSVGKLSNSDRVREGYVDFINKLGRRKDELVGDYVGTDIKVRIRFGKCGHIADIQPTNYKSGQGCAVCKGLQVQQGVNDLSTTNPHLAKEWHSVRNNGISPYDVTQGSHKKVWWKCENGHEWEATVNNRTKGSECPYCSNKKVLKGFNDIATTHPHYVKYFANIEDSHTHTHSSNKKVSLKCPDCGNIKVMQLNTLTRQGFSCDLCSDGISYSEKLMASVLSGVGIEFTKQMSYDNGEHKYDFYLPQHNAILETHGLQHYRGWLGSEEDLLQQQENDKCKRQLAFNNGILSENYHEIDCRHSTLEWCRPNIEKTLSKYVDMSVLTDEDWRQVDIQAQKSLKIEVCEYWKENKKDNEELTPKQVAKSFGIDKATARSYLKWGNRNGLCNYDAQEEREISNRRSSVLVYLIRPNGGKWFKEAMSITGLERVTGISQSTIGRNVDKGALKYRRNSKYPKEFIGSYIVSAEVYDNQTQTS